MSFSKLLVSVVLLSMLSIGQVSAEEPLFFEPMYKWPLPSILQKLLENFLEPVLSIMEPYKVSSSTNERGIPVTHE